jgi:hypothetical protein
MNTFGRVERVEKGDGHRKIVTVRIHIVKIAKLAVVQKGAIFERFPN